MIEATGVLIEGLSRLRDSLVVLESSAGWQDMMALATLPEGGVRSSCHANDVAVASKPAMAAGDVIEPDAISAGFLGDAWGSLLQGFMRWPCMALDAQEERKAGAARGKRACLGPACSWAKRAYFAKPSLGLAQ